MKACGFRSAHWSGLLPATTFCAAVDLKGLQLPIVTKPLYPFRAGCGISALSSKLNCPLLSVWPSVSNFSVTCSLEMVWLQHSSVFLTFCLCFLFVMVLLPKCHLWCITAERVLQLPQAPEESTAHTGAGASSSPACPLAMDSLVMRSSTFSPAHPYLSVVELSRSNRQLFSEWTQ